MHSITLFMYVQMCFRALHDLPAGEEITQSYFPLSVGYQERQKRLQEDYDFTCTCPRCKVGTTGFLQKHAAMLQIYTPIKMLLDTCQHSAIEM